MADITGTNGNDFINAIGQVEQVTLTIVNPYSGQSIYIDDEKFVNEGTYEGLAGIDTLILTNNGDLLFAFDTNSTPVLSNIERVVAGNGGDVIILADATQTTGDVTVDGGALEDIIWGNAGNDILFGLLGNDILDGGPGNDTLYGGSTTNIPSGDDDLRGGIGNDTIYGGDGNDYILGGFGVNSEFVNITEQTHEFSGDVVFPDLRERVDILDLVPSGTSALGIAAGDLSVEYSTTATVTFLSTGAGYNNTLGFYNIKQDGTIENVEMAFPNVKAVSSGTASTINLPGAPDTDFGFFIIANGARINQNYKNYDFENGEFKFIYDYGGTSERLANIADQEDDISLVYFNALTGDENVVNGSQSNKIYHTTERGGANNLNGDNKTHVVSGMIEGSDNKTLRIGFEDLPNLGDADYNDVVFDLTVNDGETQYQLLADDHDILYGGDGNDYIDGGIGDDLIIGGQGADTLIGDIGTDTFLYESLGDAGDRIMDFEAGTGGDILDLSALLTAFDETQDSINDFLQLTQQGSDTVLSVDQDGGADNFTALVTFDGGLGNNIDLASLQAHGNLVV